MSEFSVRCRELRKKLGITLKEMSEDIGIPLSSISKYEQGIIKPGVDILSRIAKIYKVNLNWLIANQGLMFEPEDLFLGNVSDNDIRIRLVKYDNRVKVHSLSNEMLDEAVDLKSISLSNPDASILKIADKAQRPVVVEFNQPEGEDSIKVYYPNGTIETLNREENAERNVLVKKIKSKLEGAPHIANRLEFINTSIDALDDKIAFDQLKALMKGMEIGLK